MTAIRTQRMCYCGGPTMITRPCPCVPFMVTDEKGRSGTPTALYRHKYADKNCRKCWGEGTQRLTDRYCKLTNRPMSECAG